MLESMQGAQMHNQHAVAGIAPNPAARVLWSCRLCGGPMISNSARIRQHLTSEFATTRTRGGKDGSKSPPIFMFHVSSHRGPRRTSINSRVLRSQLRSFHYPVQQIVPWGSGNSLHGTGRQMALARKMLYGRPVEMIGLGITVDGNCSTSTGGRFKTSGVGFKLEIHGSASPAAPTDHRSVIPAASEISLASKEGVLLTPELPLGLQPQLMPRHVAIIMDGNARWAKRRGMHLSMGHTAGVESLRQVVKAASKWGIDVLTVFAFSTENWRRPQVEVEFLMHMFESKLHSEMENVLRNNLQIRPVGNVSGLPSKIQNALEFVSESTRRNTGMIINFCVNYSGRADVIQACRKLAAQVAAGTISPADIDEEALANEISMSELGELRYPDLVIRTSGEHRISNFLLWQAAYSEFVFSETLWPDFGEEEFRAALLKYQKRDRRFGRRDR